MRSTRRALKITLLLAAISLLLIHGGGSVRADGPALSWDGLIEHLTAPPDYSGETSPNASSQLPRHPVSGDGGVQWVKANARTNPVTRRDLELNHYGETAMEVPYSGDPYTENLVSGYWTDVRKLVTARLASAP